MRIHQEAEAKIYVQEMIVHGKVDLVTSYVLDFENQGNRDILKQENINRFMRENEKIYVGPKSHKQVELIAARITESGIKLMDAYHIAGAIYAKCEYFLTTDDYILKYKSDSIEIVTPCEFVRRVEEDKNV